MSRQTLRLAGYDYTQPGAYFITVVTVRRKPIFGEVREAQVIYNAFGEIAIECWQAIPRHFRHVTLDSFVVMPNHVHGVLWIADYPARSSGTTCRAATGEGQEQFGRPVPGSIPTIPRSYKAAVTRRVNTTAAWPGGALWQRNYFEHVVRNDGELCEIRAYILNNPLCWGEDELDR